MPTKITRRTAITGALAGTAVLVLHTPRILAQPATAVLPSSTTSLFPGYPVLDITLTDEAIHAGSITIPTGKVVLRITNRGTSENGAVILGPGEGQTIDGLRAPLASRHPDRSALLPRDDDRGGGRRLGGHLPDR